MTDENLLIERLAIEDVFARYAHTADGYDADGWIGCFSSENLWQRQTSQGHATNGQKTPPC